MITCHRVAGCTCEDRDLNFHVEDTRGIDIGSNNDNESTDSLDTMIAFGGSEVDGCLGNLLPNSQANLSIRLMTASRSQRRSASGGIGLPRTGPTECLLCSGHNWLKPQHLQSHLEKWYANIQSLCATQK